MVMGTKTPQGARLNPQNTLELSQGMSIQTAINTADAHGGNWTIILYPGAVYNEGDLTPNGGANITIKGMGEGRVVIAPAVAPAVAVIVSAHTLTLKDVIVTAPDATMPALRVTGGTLEAEHCHFNGVGAGDAIQQIAGVIELHHCDVPIGDVDLSTGASTFSAWDCAFDGTIDTAGLFDHAITMFNCDLGGQTLNLAATGVCTYIFHNCMSMSTITDASLLGTGHLCQCDVVGAGLVVNGTSAWIVDNAGCIAVSNTDATTTATIAIYGGVVLAVTRAVGSVVWWQDGNTLKVLPSGTVTDPVIQWAIAAAGAGDTILIHPGTYQEVIALAAGVNLVGIDKDNCIINGTAVTLITAAVGCRIANLTLNATANGGNAIGIECNDAALVIEDVYINLVRVNNNAYAIAELTGNTARVIFVRNVRVTSDIDTNEAGIYSDQANKTWYVENSWFQAGDFALRILAASTVHSSNNHWESVSGVSAIAINGATVRLHNDVILGTIARAAGVITYKNANQQYEVWAGMLIGDAITAAAAEPTSPAATNPYTILIHPGIYDEVVTMATWVSLKGIGPKGSVVIYQEDTNVLILADNVELQNFTLRIGTITGTKTLIRDSLVACTARMTDLVLEWPTPTAAKILLMIGLGGAGDYIIERCSCNVVGACAVDSATIIVEAAADVHLIDNDFSWSEPDAIHLYIVAAATITGGGNRWVGACRMFRVTNGAITLDKDVIVCTGSASGDVAGGTVVCRTGEHSFEVYEGMEIQHAVGAGRYIFIHPGTFSLTASLTVAVSNITIQGSGRQTIITTATDDLDIVHADGAGGSELTNIILRDFLVRGFETGNKNDLGIYADYMDDSKIINVWVEHNGEDGIYLLNCDRCEIIDCHSYSNFVNGIQLYGTTYIRLVNCVVNSNTNRGIYLRGAEVDCSIIDCEANSNTNDGIWVRYNTCLRTIILGCRANSNGLAGIYFTGDYGSIIGGSYYNNGTHGIHLLTGDHNIISGIVATGNTQYGIYIPSGEDNIIKACKLLGNTTACFYDAGTRTRIDTLVVPFTDGSDPQDSGFEIDAGGEYARAWFQVPLGVQQVMWMKIWARSVVAEVHEMELQMVVLGGADNEPFNTHDGSVAQHDSVSVNFAADDIIHWRNMQPGTVALLGGDSVEVKVLHEAAEGDNCETDAFFRTVELGYV